MRARRIALAVASLAAGALIACGGDDSTPSTPAPTPTATTAAPLNTPPPATASASPAATASAAATVAVAPRVLWMTIDHAGTNAATVRVLTDVPTTAKLTLFGPEDGPPVQLNQPDPDRTLQVLHSFGVALPQPRIGFNLEVADANGAKAAAFLERATPAGLTYWPKEPGNLPKVTPMGNLQATVAWANNRINNGPLARGEVTVLQKKQGCTTAESCFATPLTTYVGDTAAIVGTLETHGVRVSFPDTAHDYQVIVTGTFGAANPLRAFYQIDIPGSGLKP